MAMAGKRDSFVSVILTHLIIFGIIFSYSRKKTLWHKTVDNGQDSMGIALQCLHQHSLRLPELALELNHRRHFGYSRTSSNGFFSGRITRYRNSVSTFHLSRLFISWDVDLNPGLNNEKPKCHKCSRSIARNHRSLNCSSCGFKYHIKCGEVAVKQFKQIQTYDPSIWTCSACQQHPTPEWDTNFTLLQSLPYSSISNDSFLIMADSMDTAITPSQLHKEVDENHLLDLAQKLDTHSSKDLRVAHLNVCSLRNKIEELRCLQLICRFEILEPKDLSKPKEDRNQRRITELAIVCHFENTVIEL
ncbi:uncharacterized protein LOC110046213 [Orbicella faveolata]|uniref:uncharacterized protein LOC110046213 n=1 Tax=Orbicella faveolata TaxID=48498 RepID=UPI0009E2ED41|nr:uncharacterized protein LOC110046213 [Orbicella faveolata]